MASYICVVYLILVFLILAYQDISGTLATEEAEDAAQVAKLRSALESVDHKRRKVFFVSLEMDQKISESLLVIHSVINYIY